MRVFTAVTLLSFAIFVSGCDNDNGTSSGPGGQDPNGFTNLLASTFAHPRCQNCHGMDEGNQVTVTHQNRPDTCGDCHGAAPPSWAAPFRSFSFTGLTSNEICVGIKNKFGGDVSQLSAHLKGSPLLQWGLDPVGPMLAPAGAAPPGSIAEFNQLVDQWVANGASCN